MNDEDFVRRLNIENNKKFNELHEIQRRNLWAGVYKESLINCSRFSSPQASADYALAEFDKRFNKPIGE